MSDLRRRMMLSNSKKTTDEYIQDGLIFNLDGTKKGDSLGNWTDLVSGIIFYAGTSVVELEDGFKFARTANSYMMTNNQNLSFTNSDSSNFTIEIVFSSNMGRNLWGPIFCAGSTNYNRGTGVSVSTQQNSTGGIVFNNRFSPSYVLAIPNLSLQTCSIFYKDKTFYRNGEKITSTLTATASFGHENYPAIGARYAANYGQWNNDGHLTGTLHAIRIYNRKLTENEILYNQTIDIEKYNIVV